MLAATTHSYNGLKNLRGISGAPGVALGQVMFRRPKANLANVSLKKVYASQAQTELFRKALNRTKLDFSKLREQMTGLIPKESLDIFEIYMQLIDTGSITEEIEEKVNAGWCASSALKQVIEDYVLQFESLDDPYIRERAADIRDLGNRVLYNLLQDEPEESYMPDKLILLAEEVTASMIGELQHQNLLGIISCKGSNNSHAAILARALGIPAVMGVGNFPLERLDATEVILDGYSGEVLIEPSDSLKREYIHLIEEENALQEKVMSVAQLPAITPDGKSIELLLNAGLSAGFEFSLQSGAVGIGLYRTEIPFMDRSCFPSEQEQTQWYKEVLQVFERKPVVMRTLDIGGDKSLPYFPIEEDNPFLGWRGIRITLDHPEIFLVQIRAMLKANIGLGNLEIMLPMISGIGEVDDALRLIKQAYYEICAEYDEKIIRPKVGIMIETPGVVYQLKELAQRVDFLSVGSNDLTQYLLAVDRNNSRVASIYDSFHPAVLRALKVIADEAQQYLVPLSLCGELASEPGGALMLMAMGYDKLSMNAHNIARIKWVIRHVEYQRAQRILNHCLSLASAAQVRSYLNEQLEKLGLGGLIRAGM
jgi:phosphotransferase system enzyme I (PtsP)